MLIAQSIFVHSCIHCSCYTLLDAVTQTDVVGQEYILYVALTPLPDKQELKTSTFMIYGRRYRWQMYFLRWNPYAYLHTLYIYSK